MPKCFQHRIEEVTKILILSANPRGTSPLRINEEVREIKEGLKLSRYREQFLLEISEAVRYRDIRRAILSSEPSIIHFSGHGTGKEGLAFEDEAGEVKLVTTEALAELFELFAEQVKCVILNACYSQIQAEAIAQYIPYVIGMNKAIGDKAAIEFAVGFYDALGAGKSVEFAKKLGCHAIRTAGTAEHLTPVLIKKPDMDTIETEINTEQNQEQEKYEMTFVFSGTLTADSEVEFNGKRIKIKALLQHLETFCDGELTIYDASQGSVRLRLGGSPEDLEKLQKLFQSGKLKKVLDIPIQDVQLITSETKDKNRTPEPNNTNSPHKYNSSVGATKRKSSSRYVGGSSSTGKGRSIALFKKEFIEPTFMVIGAQKCGTKWLSRNISQHPDCFVPIADEIHFFNKRANYQKGIEWYQSQFVGYAGQRAVGEFTPNYFWTSENRQEIQENDHNYDIPQLVKKHYPDIKLIVSLRNPVKRAISSYYHQIRKRRIHPSSSILDVAHQYGIVSMGFYDVHLQKWFEHFDPQSFLILILEEDISQNHENTLRRVYEFVGVDSNFQPKNARQRVHSRRNDFYTYASYYMPQFLAKSLQMILPSSIRELDLWKINISESELEELKRIYVEHNKNLSSLLNREIKW